MEGKMINDESIIYFELNYFLSQIENGAWVRKFIDIRENKRCLDLPFSVEKEKLYNVSLESWYCIDFDNVTMGGNWDGNFVYGLLINAKQCKNSTGRVCQSKENVTSNFKSSLTSSNLFYSDLSIEIMPTMDDFESPLKSSLKNRYEMLNLNFTKRKVQTFKATYLDNDKGWLFPVIDKTSIYSTDDILNDFTMKDQWDQDIVFTQLIYFGKKYENYFRSYSKVQEVFASIGGFSSFFLTFLSSIFLFFSDFYRVLLLIYNLPFDATNDQPRNSTILFKSEFNLEILKYLETNKENTFDKNSVKNLNKITEKSTHNHNFTTAQVTHPSLGEYLFSVCNCNKKKLTQAIFRKKMKKFILYDKYYHNVMNILTYFNLYNEFQNIKHILLNEDEAKNLGIIKPLTISKLFDKSETISIKDFNYNENKLFSFSSLSDQSGISPNKLNELSRT